jgi:hypothetical protein
MRLFELIRLRERLSKAPEDDIREIGFTLLAEVYRLRRVLDQIRYDVENMDDLNP